MLCDLTWAQQIKGELPHGKLKVGVKAVEHPIADLNLEPLLTKTCFLNTTNRNAADAVSTHPTSKKYFATLPMSNAEIKFTPTTFQKDIAATYFQRYFSIFIETQTLCSIN